MPPPPSIRIDEAIPAIAADLRPDLDATGVRLELLVDDAIMARIQRPVLGEIVSATIRDVAGAVRRGSLVVIGAFHRGDRPVIEVMAFPDGPDAAPLPEPVSHRITRRATRLAARLKAPVVVTDQVAPDCFVLAIGLPSTQDQKPLAHDRGAKSGSQRAS